MDTIFTSIFFIFFFSAIMFIYDNYLSRPLNPHQITALTGVKLKLAQEFFKKYPDSWLSRKELESMYRNYLSKKRVEDKIRKQREAINSTLPDENQKIRDNT